MNSSAVTHTILQDTAALKIVGVNPILIHGGGPEINEQLAIHKIHSEFKNGLRVTSKEAMTVVQMALAGKLNKNLVKELGTLGVKAVGLSGMDAKLIEAKPLSKELGMVGSITKINTELINAVSKDFIPVISTIAVGKNGESYNINADIAAGAIGGALNAEKLLFLTDIDGIRKDPNDPKSLITKIKIKDVEAMIKSGAISGGMIPKVQACIEAIKSGVSEVMITNGTVPHAILLELFTAKGVGTLLTA